VHWLGLSAATVRRDAITRMVLTNQNADGGDCLDGFVRDAAGVVSVEGIQTAVQVIDPFCGSGGTFLDFLSRPSSYFACCRNNAFNKRNHQRKRECLRTLLSGGYISLAISPP
jgi:hypothetical protein